MAKSEPPILADEGHTESHTNPLKTVGIHDVAAPPPRADGLRSTGDWSAGVLAPTEIVIPGHDILSKLGRGGMGVVYKARHRALNRVVAVKMILNGAHAGTQERDRFRAEAEAVARLQHPNIVQVFEVGDAGGHPYCSLEFADGGSLAARLDGTPLPARDAARMIETLARAMQHAHEAGIVHRDLKPHNVLLVADVTPKITDFGLAKLLDDDGTCPVGPTESGAILGTPSYMAPEQAEGKVREVGPSADIYALGAILYELLTGRPPFKGPSPFDTLVQVVEAEPVSPRNLQPTLPRDLETVCLKCLAKQPPRRYASAGELADDLARFLSHEPIRARRAGPLYRLGKVVQRNKGLVTGLTAAVVAVFVGLIGVGLSLLEVQVKRDRARQAEASLVRSHAQASSYYDLARLALARGNWREALSKLDLAAQAGHPDSPALALDRARALCALHDLPGATKELNALAGRDDLGELEGEVLLWQAHLAMKQTPQNEESLAKVRRALHRGLPPAQAAHAQPLLARSTPEAVAHLRKARRRDLHNPRVNAMLAPLLTCMGRHEEAAQVIRQAELNFAEDPTSPSSAPCQTLCKAT
jgi:tetratricopeptide (TPR) repeat protein